MNIDKIPFKFPAGIELTFVVDPAQCPAHMQKNPHFDPDSIVNEVASLMEYMADIPSEYLYDGICTDPGVVEIPTKVLKSWPEMKRVYNCISGEAKRFFLKPRNEQDAGGDGHIHVSGLTIAEQNFLYKDLIQRPYLHWAFIHPYDDSNAPTVLHWMRNPGYWESIDWNTRLRVPSKNFIGLVTENSRDVTYLVPRDKVAGVCYRDGNDTQEFRIFWTPANLQEQIEHMALVQSYLGWIRKQVKANQFPKVDLKNADGAMKMLKTWRNFERCKREFNLFLKMIGLDTRDYAKNVKRMKTRFTEYPKHLF